MTLRWSCLTDRQKVWSGIQERWVRAGDGDLGTTRIYIRDQRSYVIEEEDMLMEKRRRLRIGPQAMVVLRDLERRVMLERSHKIVLPGK